LDYGKLSNIPNNLSSPDNLLTSNSASNIFDTISARSTALTSYQSNLTASTNLLGIGSSITALNATNITSGTLSTARGGTQWTYYNSSNIYYTTSGGNVMTNSILCNYGQSNFTPNSSNKSYILLKHNTYNGNIGTNYPDPECALMMTNASSSNALPWGFYNGVVKYFASVTPNNSLRYDIGTSAINNTIESQSGTNTFTPLLSILYLGNIGIGATNPKTTLDVNGKLISVILHL